MGRPCTVESTEGRPGGALAPSSIAARAFASVQPTEGAMAPVGSCSRMRWICVRSTGFQGLNHRMLPRVAHDLRELHDLPSGGDPPMIRSYRHRAGPSPGLQCR